MKSLVLSHLNAIAENKAFHIDNYLSQKKKVADILSESPVVTEAMIEYNKYFLRNNVYSNEYSALDERFKIRLSVLLEASGYYDLLLINLDGDIIFTVKREKDYGKNINIGDFKNLSMSDRIQKSISTQKPEFSDFEYYFPSNDYATFIIIPLQKNKKKIGVIAYQLRSKDLYKTMEDYTGLGKTGEIVLASRIHDYAFFITPTRHDHFAAFKRKVFIGEETGFPIQEAVQGRSGKGNSVDYRNINILAAWKYLPSLRLGMVVKIDTEEAYINVSELSNWVLLTIGIIALSVLTLALLISKTISKPIIELTRATKSIAEGNFDHIIKIQARNEIGELIKAVNDMTISLLNAKNKALEENWYKSGHNELNKLIRAELDISSIAQKSITFLCHYLNAQIGAFYLYDKNDKLHLITGYAFSERKNISNEFDLGQGIIGQCALEKETILITRVPKDYVQIRSGLGEASPLYIIATPILMNESIKGVIEIGSMEEYKSVYKPFLKQACESIAIAIDLAQSNRKITELLNETRLQQEKLQTNNKELEIKNQTLQEQSEELNTINEELEEKSQIMQEQSEELRVANEELREKSTILETQTGELKNKKQELEEKAKALELTSKYKSAFLANMSHELRTPLNSLLILAKTLKSNDEKNLTDEQIESLRVIYNSGENLLYLINDILDLSKIESGKLSLLIEDIEIQPVLENLKAQFLPIANEKNIEFIIRTQGVYVIKTDRQRLEQVLRNLLSNAFKFTKQGSVTLEVSKESQNTVVFSVTDTGIGVPVDKQRIIFEAFQQVDTSTSRKYGGTGLGLSISRELANLLNGKLELQSEGGKGSRFTLLLSIDNQNLSDKSIFLSEEQPKISLVEGIHQPPLLTDDRENIQKEDKIILVLDNDKEFLNILTDHIHKKGYKILLAADIMNILHLAIQYHPSAIILGFGVQEKEESDILERLKENPITDRIPIHIISPSENSVPLLGQNEISYISKPITTEAILKILNSLERMIRKNIKEMLIVEDEEINQLVITSIAENRNVNITCVKTGLEAYKKILSQKFDCIILDLGLPDISGLELLQKLNSNLSMENIPVIVHTAKTLTKEEHLQLSEFAKSIIIKGANSTERLIDEISLFLHTLESSRPSQKRTTSNIFLKSDNILQDKKILLVDDDLRNVFTLSKILRKFGLKVIIADNGELALQKLQEEGPIDLIIMDIMMPIMDGYEAMKKIRSIHKFQKVPIIALTAKTMPEDKSKCLEAGANDYLTKPVDVEKLISVIKIWLLSGI